MEKGHIQQLTVLCQFYSRNVWIYNINEFSQKLCFWGRHRLLRILQKITEVCEVCEVCKITNIMDLFYDFM